MHEKQDKDTDRDTASDVDASSDDGSALQQALDQIKFKPNHGTYIVLPRSPGSVDG